MTAYRDRLAEMLQTMDAEVTQAPGRGLPLPVAHGAGPAGGSMPRRDPAWNGPKQSVDIRELLSGYERDLESLGEIPPIPGAWSSSLSTGSREIVQTLLPVAANMRRTAAAETADDRSVEAARRWSIERVRRTLATFPARSQE